MTAAELAALPCAPRRGDEHRLDARRASELLVALPGWQLDDAATSIAKEFRFPDFHQTLGFIGAVGFLANQADHHPDIEAGYGHCRLRWNTHDCGGLSLNDFICAARVERLFGV